MRLITWNVAGRATRQPEQAGANIFERVDVVRRDSSAGEREEMRPLVGVELESACERPEHRLGGADFAPFQPLDVIDAHGRQRGNFFASQSLDPPAAARIEPDVFRLDPRPP